MKTKAKTADSITLEKLTTLCNLKRSRIYQLSQEGRIPAPVRGVFTMPEVIQKLFAYYQSDFEAIARERLLHLRATRLIAERQNAIAQGEADRTLMATEDVEAMLKIITDCLERIPGRLASETGISGEASNRLQTIIDEARMDAEARLKEHCKDFPEHLDLTETKTERQNSDEKTEN
jgi:predicted DNA-binding transcriptional regulator AlpA